MKLNQALLASVTIVGFGLAIPAIGILPRPDPAIAATNVGVSISFGTFYDRLAPHGTWVSYHDAYVFVPRGVAAGWRPYTLGHWTYTRPYGWLWVSAEPFGWATYHYGRWGYAEDIGWYWVPGSRWAPAWVAWRRSDNYVAWAPLPVDYPDDNFSVNISFGKVPAFYWQAVEAPAFLSIDLGHRIVRDRAREEKILAETRPLGGLKVVNKTVVNNVIEVKFVEQKTKRKVVVHQIRKANDPRMAGKANGTEIAVFDPQVKKTETKNKPKVVKSVDQIKAPDQNADKKNSDLTTKKTQQMDQTDQSKMKQQTGQTDQPKKKQQTDQTDQPKKKQQTGQTDQPKKKQQTGQTDQSRKKQQTGQKSGKKAPAQANAQDKKKKKKVETE